MTQTHTDQPDGRMDADAVARALEGHMDAIMQLLEAMAAEDPEADMKLAALLEGEPEQVRVAILEKLQALLRSMASEKEKELEKMIDAEKRVAVERQRNIFLLWLQWIMSEETLRKIREAFLAQPSLERSVMSIGHDLAAKGVLVPERLSTRQELGELSVNLGVGKSTERDKGKGV